METTQAGDIQEASRSYWAGRVDAVHRHADEPSFRRYAEELLALLPHGGTLLDVGCGSCQITTYLAPAFDRVVATDFSDSMLEAGRQRAADLKLTNITFAHGEAVRFPAESRSADVILAHGVIQYLDQTALEKHLAECARVLAPGGLICWGLVPNSRLRWMWYLRLLSGPRPSAVEMARRWFQICRNWRRAKRNGDLLWDGIGNWFDPDTLRAQAARAGFDTELRHSWFYEYRFHVLLRRQGAESENGTR